jgi:hypothetical protein
LYISTTTYHIEEKREIVAAGRPKINIPGNDSFLLPKTIPVAGKPVVGRMPEKFAVRVNDIQSS